MRHKAVLVLGCLLLAVALAACGGTLEPAPAVVYTPVLTPDIEATVEARIEEKQTEDAALEAKAQAMAKAMVEATAQAVPTATPYLPTIEDFEAVALPQIAGSNPLTKSIVLGRFPDYAGLYVGQECIRDDEGSTLRAKAFRDFVGRTAFDRNRMTLEAQTVVDQLAEMVRQRELGGKCSEFFMFPETAAQAQPMIWLMTARSTTSPLFRSYIPDIMKRRVYSWFSEESPPPLLLWCITRRACAGE